MAASADADALVISASGLSAGLAALLDVLADVLTEAAHPKAAVRAAKERISQELTIARTVPGLVARTAIARRAHGEHPYARGLTTVEQIDALSAGAVRKAHAGCVRPRGALLVIVSDRPAAGVLRLVEKALAGWTGGKKVHPAPPLPAPAPGPAWLVHRPGAVQSNLRLAGPGLPRQSVDYPALRLAVMVYGGYFSSRLVANIREDKGWTYSPGSALSVRPAGTTISVAAEVATAVSAAALWETVHELGRMATVAVDLAELDAARQYVLGTTALSLASQAGLASAVLTMAAAGLDLAWLKEHQAQLLRVTAEDVLRVSQAHLGPAHLTAAIVGDAEVVSAPLSAVMSIVPASVEA
jgi:zinc protease